jgi:alpha-glucosidase
MHWNASAQGGFTSGKPWLPLDPHFRSCHVEGLRDDPTSILMLYWRLIQLRRQHLALSVGSYKQVAAEGDVLAYERQHASERFLVALNLGNEPHTLSLPAGTRGHVMLSTLPDRGEEQIEAQIVLRADEGLIIMLGT